MSKYFALSAASIWLLVSCTPKTYTDPIDPEKPASQEVKTRTQPSEHSQPTTRVVIKETDTKSRDDPRISRSRGVEGGVVLLWPRIIPGSDFELLEPQAAGLQARLRQMIVQTLPDAPIDTRPSPERVCPKAGCVGISVGVLLLHQEYGCAAIALIGEPGPTPIRLVHWAGRLRVKAERIPFRDYPESYITITDFVPCDQLLNVLNERELDVRNAIREAAL